MGSLFAFTGCGNKTDSWDVKLVSFDSSSKIKIIKEIMELKDIGLAEANEIKAKFEEIGAVIELAPSK